MRLASACKPRPLSSYAVSDFMNFIKKNPLKKMLLLQKKVYELDLASKGFGGMTKDQFWQELDNMVISLTSN